MWLAFEEVLVPGKSCRRLHVTSFSRSKTVQTAEQNMHSIWSCVLSAQPERNVTFLCRSAHVPTNDWLQRMLSIQTWKIVVHLKANFTDFPATKTRNVYCIISNFGNREMRVLDEKPDEKSKTKFQRVTGQPVAGGPTSVQHRRSRLDICARRKRSGSWW